MSVFVLDGVLEKLSPDLSAQLSFCQKCYLAARNALDNGKQGKSLHADEDLSQAQLTALARLPSTCSRAAARTSGCSA